MTSGGFYNHYDDPDEFWDDEPIEIKKNAAAARYSPPMENRLIGPKSPVPVPVPRVQEAGPDMATIEAWNVSGSAFARMDLDRGLLPVGITVADRRGSHDMPGDWGSELLRSYEFAVARELSRMFTSNCFLSEGGLDLDCGVPGRRTQLAILLETTSWIEYQAVLSSLTDTVEYRVEGGARHHGRPVVHVTADRMAIKSIAVAPDWAAAVHPSSIVGEVLDCAEQVRRLRPSFTVGSDYVRYSEEDLEYHHERHVRSLLENLR